MSRSSMEGLRREKRDDFPFTPSATRGTMVAMVPLASLGVTADQYPGFCVRFGLVVSSEAGSGKRSRWGLVARPACTPPFHCQT